MKTINFEQFSAGLVDAYEHIYDLVYLRTHALLEYFVGQEPNAHRSAKEAAWEFHHSLLNTIQELDPGPQAPSFSREWRRHRLMVLRYIDGLSPQVVADQLAISRRHFYREHEGAMNALAAILWRRLDPENSGIRNQPTIDPPSVELETTELSSKTVAERLELIRLEAAQMAQIAHRTQLPEVLDGVLTLLHDKAQKRSLAIENYLKAAPDIWGDYRLVRQLLLGLLGHLINMAHNGIISINTTVTDQSLILSLIIDAQAEITPMMDAATQTPVSVFEELAALSSAALEPVRINGTTCGFTVTLPLYAGRRGILVVDDNEDILELFERYLKPHKYEVIPVRVSSGAVTIAKSVQPSAIILDLMMPDQDGWDLLQTLRNQPETESIPIIICSILRQRELALSLGATAFLEKPVSEQKLLAVIDILVADR